MSLRVITVIFAIIALVACRSMGGVAINSEQVSVSVGQKVSLDDRKIRKLRKLQTVETLHRYITHRLNKMDMGQTLKFDVTITSYRIGFGRDHMGINVIVRENGEVVQEFDEVETTGRSNPTAKLSKGLARRIIDRVKGL